jgi:PKD repeat protein
VYRGKTFTQQYQGAFFYGDYARRFIRYLTFHPNGALESDHDFAKETGPVVHITQGPDDALYYVLFNGEIRRIQYEKGRNHEPIPKVTYDVRFGQLPLTVQFSAKGSFDIEGDALKFRWQFGDGSSASGIDAAHTYTDSENFLARCIVTDARGAQSPSDSIKIFAGDRPPIPVINQPKDGTRVHTGQKVNFSGFANDTEDGPIDVSNLVWTVILLHNDHTHPFLGPITGTKSGSFVVPHRHGAGFIAYRIRLKATDSRGLSIIHQVDVTHSP